MASPTDVKNVMTALKDLLKRHKDLAANKKVPTEEGTIDNWLISVSLKDQFVSAQLATLCICGTNANKPVFNEPILSMDFVNKSVVLKKGTYTLGDPNEDFIDKLKETSLDNLKSII